ncbi:hypothetical protein J7L67_09955 [bacterium]|nr:hypothetical protein [bacterium]
MSYIKRKKSNILSLLSFLLTSTALILLFINCLGLFKSLRNPAIYTETNLLFKNDITLNLKTVKKEILKKPNETKQQYAVRLNEVIQHGIAHIFWDDEDVNKYYLKIPIWENYILFALSYSPFFDDCKRYHFSGYKKSIERGVGVCGDVALILSAILEENNIDTHIIAYDDHVITEVNIDKDNNTWWLFDPDFGVIIKHSLAELKKNPQLAKPFYIKKGYSEQRGDLLVSIYKTKPDVYDNVYSFGPTKAIVEQYSYYIIWIFPFILLILSKVITTINNHRKRLF